MAENSEVIIESAPFPSQWHLGLFLDSLWQIQDQDFTREFKRFSRELLRTDLDSNDLEATTADFRDWLRSRPSHICTRHAENKPGVSQSSFKCP